MEGPVPVDKVSDGPGVGVQAPGGKSLEVENIFIIHIYIIKIYVAE